MNPPRPSARSRSASGPVVGGMNPPTGAIASLNAFPGAIDRSSVPTATMKSPKKKGPTKAALAKHERLLRMERELWGGGLRHVAGLDEVGAGPWAGPLFAACVVLDPARLEPLIGVNDSKQLSAERREELDQQIRACALAFAVSECSVEEIDRINIRQAALLAMRRALDAVQAQLGGIDRVLIDAHTLPDLPILQQPIVKGDATSLSIAAASIVAKVARDAVMRRFAEQYPGYGFEQHKGYGTAQHQDALSSLGPTPIHRRSFAPIRTILEGAPSRLAIPRPPA